MMGQTIPWASMNREVYSIFIASLVILTAGATAYVYVQQGQINDLKTSLTTKDFEIARLNASLKARPSIDGRNVTIGVIAPTTDSLANVKAIVGLAAEDINSYCRNLGRNLTFSFIVEDAMGQVGVHLEKVQAFDSADIDLIIGGQWNTQVDGSIQYLNTHEMLMISPASPVVQTTLSIPNDNVFRLSVDNAYDGHVITKMLDSFDIKAVIVIQGDDSWADELYTSFKEAFESRGGVIFDRIIYPTEIIEFSSLLQRAEAKAQEAVTMYGKGRVAIELMSYDRTNLIAKGAKDYPTIYGLPWFGSDMSAESPVFTDQIPEEAGHLKIFSPYIALPYSERHLEINHRYYSVTGEDLGFYTANWYDAAWIYADAVIEA